MSDAKAGMLRHSTSFLARASSHLPEKARSGKLQSRMFRNRVWSNTMAGRFWRPARGINPNRVQGNAARRD